MKEKTKETIIAIIIGVGSLALILIAGLLLSSPVGMKPWTLKKSLTYLKENYHFAIQRLNQELIWCVATSKTAI